MGWRTLLLAFFLLYLSSEVELSRRMIALMGQTVRDVDIVRMYGLQSLGFETYFFTDTNPVPGWTLEPKASVPFLEVENVIWVPDESLRGWGNLTALIKKEYTAWSRALYWAATQWEGMKEAMRNGHLDDVTVWFFEEDVAWKSPAVIGRLIRVHERTGTKGGLMTVVKGIKKHQPRWPHWERITKFKHLLPTLFNQTRPLPEYWTRNRGLVSRRRNTKENRYVTLMQSYNVLCALSGRLLAEIETFGQRNGHLLFHEVLFINLCNDMMLRGLTCSPHIIEVTDTSVSTKFIRFRPVYGRSSLMSLPSNVIAHPVKNEALLLQWMQVNLTIA